MQSPLAKSPRRRRWGRLAHPAWHPYTACSSMSRQTAGMMACTLPGTCPGQLMQSYCPHCLNGEQLHMPVPCELQVSGPLFLGGTQMCTLIASPFIT